MPIASIDVGSNSIRLLIGDVSGGVITPIRYERIITRLSQGLQHRGFLRKPNMEKTIKALKDFLRLIRKYKVRYIKSVGTSALREAENSKDFIERVYSELGLNIEVLSGIKEAGLSLRGVLLSILTTRDKGSYFIIDIGGGSTEWTLLKNRKPLRHGTLPVGVVKLHERHIHSDPPLTTDIASLEKELKKTVKKIKEKITTYINNKTSFIATAGTATTLAGIDLGLLSYEHEKVHMHRMSIERLTELKNLLTKLPLRERAKIRGLEPERADLIIPGIHLTIKLMEGFGFRNVTISDYGLLEGALLKLSEEVRD